MHKEMEVAVPRPGEKFNDETAVIVGFGEDTADLVLTAVEFFRDKVEEIAPDDLPIAEFTEVIDRLNDAAACLEAARPVEFRSLFPECG